MNANDSTRQRQQQQRPTPSGPPRQSSQGSYAQQQGNYRPNKYAQPTTGASGDQFGKQFGPTGHNFPSNYNSGMYGGMQQNTSPGNLDSQNLVYLILLGQPATLKSPTSGLGGPQHISPGVSTPSQLPSMGTIQMGMMQQGATATPLNHQQPGQFGANTTNKGVYGQTPGVYNFNTPVQQRPNFPNQQPQFGTVQQGMYFNNAQGVGQQTVSFNN